MIMEEHCNFLSPIAFTSGAWKVVTSLLAAHVGSQQSLYLRRRLIGPLTQQS